MSNWLMRAVVAISCVCVGCGHEAEPVAEQVDDPNVLELETGEYELAPGEETYLCYTFDVPEEGIRPVVSIEPDYGRGVHHVFFAYTILPETAPSGSECSVLFKTSWIPMYLGGVDSGPLELPGDAAFEFSTNQLVLQLHLQNTNPEPIKDTVTMKVRTAEEGQEITRAGIFGIDNRVIDLPANTQDVPTKMECEPGRDMDVFGVLGHMHKLGKSIHLSDLTNERTLFEADWDFDDQPIRPVDFSLSVDDRLSLECRHDNPNAKPALYGESSDTEMCAAVLYYTPFDVLDGCIVE